MGHLSQVFAGMIGSKAALEKCLQSITPILSDDEKEALSDFQWVNLENDCWVYGYYGAYIKWYEPSQNLWHILTTHAKKNNLSYVFYRLGKHIYDAEVDKYCADNDEYFYRILVESVTINRSIDLDDSLRTVLYD